MIIIRMLKCYLNGKMNEIGEVDAKHNEKKKQTSNNYK